MTPSPLRFTLFPYTTLFRSLVKDHDGMVVSIDAPMMSLEVTPEHRLVSRRRGGAKGGEPYFYAADMTAGTLLRSEEHTSELQSRGHLVCRLLLEKKKKSTRT